MAAGTLYDLLEITPSASAEMVATAYRAKCDQTKRRERSDPEGTLALRSALDEAYRTLSDPDARRRYDAKLASRELAQMNMSMQEVQPSWISRNMILGLLVGAALVGTYSYHRHVQAEKLAAEKRLKEEQARLAVEKAKREAVEQEQAAARAERQRRIEEAQHYRWMEQTRREGAAHSRQLQLQEQMAKREGERQQRMADIQRQREETEARMRLEQEKRKLEALERQNSYAPSPRAW